MHNFSILDTKPSHVLGFPMTVSHQLWFIFLLPAFTLLIFYIIDVATDIAVGIELISEQKFILGGVTLALTFLPPFITYIQRLATPPETKEVKTVFSWFSIETAAFIVHPIRPIQCIGERIFWSIEAIRLEDPHREEALIEYEATKVPLIENYLFMQAFLQAAPQAIFQTILLALAISSDKQMEILQGVCVVSSIATLALVTSSYQRYEAQVRGGRPEVWSSYDRSFSSLLTSAEELEQAPPQRQRWTKVMEEDNPVGRICSFTFWFIFVFGRIISLVTASLFLPWTVLTMCAVHYLFSFIYILPSPECKSAIPAKILLALVYIFCLIEVRIPFRKSIVLYTLFFVFSYIEDISLTLLWAIWGKWSSNWCYNALYVIGVTHLTALIFIAIYFKFFKPRVQRLGPL